MPDEMRFEYAVRPFKGDDVDVCPPFTAERPRRNIKTEELAPMAYSLR
jgi:hypothetical protein